MTSWETPDWEAAAPGGWWRALALGARANPQAGQKGPVHLLIAARQSLLESEVVHYPAVYSMVRPIEPLLPHNSGYNCAQPGRMHYYRARLVVFWAPV